jgi:asparagine synthase (glutamine-hydrolysing)
VWAASLQGTVRDAVRRQMVSDVPLGSFLSGGVDSSAIVAEMSSVRTNVPTYTVGFSAADLGHEPVPDDLKYARQVGGSSASTTTSRSSKPISSSCFRS